MYFSKKIIRTLGSFLCESTNAKCWRWANPSPSRHRHFQLRPALAPFLSFHSLHPPENGWGSTSRRHCTPVHVTDHISIKLKWQLFALMLVHNFKDPSYQIVSYNSTVWLLQLLGTVLVWEGSSRVSVKSEKIIRLNRFNFKMHMVLIKKCWWVKFSYFSFFEI